MVALSPPFHTAVAGPNAWFYQNITIPLDIPDFHGFLSVVLPVTSLASLGPSTFIQIHFQPDAQEQPVELFHHLKLYEEGEPQGVPLPANKKPVISVSKGGLG